MPEHPFDLMIQQPDKQIRVVEAALFIARDHCPSLKIGPYLERLDGLARRVDRLKAKLPGDRIEALRAVLVDEQGFAGNTSDYYDPRNSLLNEVLDRKTGIPITLSAVWLDISRQLDWPIYGVGLPGHYIIKYSQDHDEILIDPFSGGSILDREQCRQMARSVLNRPIELDDSHFAAMSSKATLTRMLNNLHPIYISRQAWYNAACVLQRLLAMHPDSEELQEQLRFVAAHLARLN